MGNSLSASSSSSAAASTEKYDVFISFRGEDTRDNFTSHLHKALCEKQIDTFIDNGLEKGDEIWLNLSKNIRKSKMSVVIFSKDYVSSKWCLRELVEIMECREKNGQTVIPVFYQVDPSHVRKQKGSFVEHENQVQEEVPKWRKALTEASNLTGWDSSVTKPEAKLVKEIVRDVEKKLTSGGDIWSPSDFKGLIGLDERIEQAMSLLSLHKNDDIRIIGIWGMGGIGKTTLANVIYNKISHQFERKCFIRDVRGRLEQSGGSTLGLQKEFLSKVLSDNKNLKLDGTTFSKNIKKMLSKRKMFIILDDVDDFINLEELAGGLDQFASGSRIMITSRDKQVLENCTGNAHSIYEVKGFRWGEALKHFCNFAFKKDYPTDDLREFSFKIVNYAKGNPLALKVLGSSLFRKSKLLWESAIANLQENFKGRIFDVLKISYDRLDDEEKNMFLDIACFSKGEYIEDVTKIYGDNASYLLSVLEDKSLITVPSYGPIGMHDLLQEMGREIVRRESNRPDNRSRLWREEDVLNILKNGNQVEPFLWASKSRLNLLKKLESCKNNLDVSVDESFALNKINTQTGTEKVRGIVLCMDMMVEDINLSPQTFENLKGLKFLKFWMRYHSEYEYRYKIYCPDELTYLSNELRSLIWLRCPLKGIPPNFLPNYNIIELDLSYSNLEMLTEDIMVVPKLKWLILQGCERLTRISKHLHAPSLIKIDLAHCKRLLAFPSLDESSLKQLCELDLRWCRKLKHLPRKIHFESLISLCFSCSNLETFQEDIMFVPKLTCLVLYKCERLTSISKRLHAPLLEKIDIRICEELLDFPSPDEHSLKQLNVFIIEGCQKLKQLPSIHFESLVSLSLSYNNLEILQEDILFVPKLKSLILKDCRYLTSISKYLHAPLLKKIDLRNCEELLDFPPPDEHSLKQLYEFIIQGCIKLKQLPSIHFESLVSLRLSYSNLEILQEDTLFIPKLKILILKGCRYLTSISKHLHAPLLEKIDLQNCVELLDFPSPDEHSLKQLREFIIQGCIKLKQLPSIRFKSVVSLRLSYINLEILQEDILFIPKLKGLMLKGCRYLTSISKHLHAPLLEKIDLQNCVELLDLPSPDEHSLKQLREFSIEDCKKLKQLPSIHFESLVSLSLSYCNLETLQEDTLFAPKLKSLILKGCRYLTSISKHLNAPLLEKIYIQNCEEFIDFPSFDEHNLKQLRVFIIEGCKKLKQLPSIHFEFLVSPSLNYNNLEILQEDTLFVPKLRSLILKGCRYLTSISKHLHAPLLEKIDIQNCEELLDFPSPDEHSLKQVRVFIIEGCKKLKQLPSVHFESLVSLILSYSSLEILQEDNLFVPKLKSLILKGCQYLTSISKHLHAPLLEKIDLQNCVELLGFPSPDKHSLKQLREFIIQGCRQLKQLPSIIFESLVSLSLSYSNFETLQDDTLFVPKLKSLILKGCQNLTSISKQLHSPLLETIDVRDCEELLDFPSPDEHSLKQLRELNMWNCKKLKQLPSKIHCESLKALNLRGCIKLTSIPDLSKASLLKDLNLEDCVSLPAFPRLAQHLQELDTLCVSGCTNIRSFSSEVHFESLESLDLRGCNNLTTFPQFSGNIKILNMRGTAIDVVPSSIQNLTRLCKLNLSDCTRLERISIGLCKLKSLEHLDLEDCSKLESFPDILETMEHMKFIDLSGTAIKELPNSIGNMTGLLKLNLRKCKNLETLPDSICNLMSLTHLDLSDCSNLKILWEKLANLNSLVDLAAERLKIRQLPNAMTHMDNIGSLSDYNLQEIPKDFGSLFLSEYLGRSGNYFKMLPESFGKSNKGFLYLDNCNMLQSLTDLPSTIKYLSAVDCKQLRSVPDAYKFAVLSEAEFIFTNCLNLEETMVNNILERSIEEYKQKDFSVSFQEKKKYFYRSNISICCPGGEVPQLFNYQSEKSWIQVQTKWRDFEKGELVGFAVCAVIEFKEYHFRGCGQAPLKVLYAFQDGICIFEGSIMVVSRNETLIDSDHVALSLFGCGHWVAKRKNSNFLFKFCLSQESCHCKVKSCGVYPIYQKRHITIPRISNVNFGAIDQDFGETSVKVDNNIKQFPGEAETSGRFSEDQWNHNLRELAVDQIQAPEEQQTTTPICCNCLFQLLELLIMKFTRHFI